VEDEIVHEAPLLVDTKQTADKYWDTAVLEHVGQPDHQTPTAYMAHDGTEQVKVYWFKVNVVPEVALEPMVFQLNTDGTLPPMVLVVLPTNEVPTA
jgi:hypothetical protein